MTNSNTTALRRRTVLAAALGAIGLAAVAAPPKAQAYGGDIVDLQVIDRESGRPIEVWRKNGRAYIAGQPGARYAVRVSNNTGGRVLVVMSVDGVNILTGQTAAQNQRGYVLGPYQSYDVAGWRKSDQEVAAFNFARLSRSYAARTGRPGDVGVIGVAAFQERVYRLEPLQEQSRDRYDSEADEAAVSRRAAPSSRYQPSPVAPQGAAKAMRPEEKLGTGHGAREWSSVSNTTFERATAYPQMVRQIEYDTYDNLAALGVIPRYETPERHPRPFPSSGGYVPDPPRGYRY